MKINFFFFFILFFQSTLFGQNKIRPIEDLINNNETGWIVVKRWISNAKNKVIVLPCDTLKAKEALYQTQVTTRSPLGAVIYMTGGILIDNGWIRILGSGNNRLNRTVPDWNKGKTFISFGEKPSYLLIADDVIGGLFAINLGGLGKDTGNVYYFAPDNLKWESLDLTYSNFLIFCFNNNLNNFYEGFRWKTWEADAAKLNGNSVYSFSTPFWLKNKVNINKNKRTIVPIEEQYQFNMQVSKEINEEN